MNNDLKKSRRRERLTYRVVKHVATRRVTINVILADNTAIRGIPMSNGKMVDATRLGV